MLEHQWRHSTAAGDLQLVQQCLTVDVAVEQRECGVDLARRLPREPAAYGGQRGRRRLRVEFGLEDGQCRSHAVDQTLYVGREGESTVEHDRRDLRKAE